MAVLTHNAVHFLLGYIWLCSYFLCFVLCMFCSCFLLFGWIWWATGKTCLQNDLWWVDGCVKPYSVTYSGKCQGKK